MRFLTFSHRGFRNLVPGRLPLGRDRHLFLGDNGQGKSNLLEGLGLVSALRSFRTLETRHLVAWGETSLALAWEVDSTLRGRTEIRFELGRGRKELLVDGARVARLADHLGHFPTVVFCAQDLQLLRGSPGARRRLLDQHLASLEPAYLEDLRRYARALEGRNALLRSGGGDASCAAFERTMAPHAAALRTARAAGLAALAVDLASAHAAFDPSGAPPELRDDPDLEVPDEAGWEDRWARDRQRDRAAGSTGHGPHRDDFKVLLGGRDAREYASEGQQRSLVLALRLAQVAGMARRTGERPVVLADDILGELDPGRRVAFWNAVDPACQVIATGTVVPALATGSPPWEVSEVAGGQVHGET